MSEPPADPNATPPVAEGDRLRVFVSYARADASDFAEYMVVALKSAGFDAYLDRHDIAKAEDWERRLGELIARSDTVVFLISPASIKSPRCDWEVKRTVQLGKRLVPVQWIEVPEAEVPVELKRRNYTVFKSGEPFGAPMAELAQTLRQDLGWLRQLTQVTENAERWDGRNRDGDLLLRGSALAEAADWVRRRKAEAPQIPALVMAFIGASEEAQAARQSKESIELGERRRLVERAELAQKGRNRAMGLVGALVTAMLVSSFWLWTETAERETRLLLSRAQEAMRNGQHERAMQFALASMPPPGATGLIGAPDGAEALLAQAAMKSRLITRLGGEDAQFESASFSPDGTLILTHAKGEKAAVLWDGETGKRIRSLDGHTGEIESASFLEGEMVVQTHAEDNTMRLWDARTGQQIGQIGQPGEQLGRAVLSAGSKRGASWADGGGISVWDVASGQRIARIEQAKAARDEFEFSLDGRRISTLQHISEQESIFRLWDADSGRQIGEEARLTYGMVLFSPVSDRLVVSDNSRGGLLVDAADNSTVARLDAENLFGWHRFSSDGRQLVFGAYSGPFQLLDARTGKPWPVQINAKLSVREARLTKDGTRLVVVENDRRASVWDLASGEMIGNRAAPGTTAPNFQFDASEQWGLFVDSGRDVHVWKLGEERVRRLDSQHERSRLSFSTGAPRVATSGLQRDYVAVWDLETGNRVASFSSPGDPDVRLRADGRRALSRDRNAGAVRLWNVESAARPSWEYTGGERVDLTLWNDTPTAVVRTAKNDLRVIDPFARATAASIDGTNFTSGGEGVEPIVPGALALGGNGTRLAVDEDQISIFDVRSSKQIDRVTPWGSDDAILVAGTFSRDGKRLLLVLEDNSKTSYLVRDVELRIDVGRRELEGTSITLAAHPSLDQIAYVRDDKIVLVPTSGEGAELTVEAPDSGAQMLVFDRAGNHLLWSGGRAVAALFDSKLKPLHILPAGRGADIAFASFSTDDRHVVTYTDDTKMVRVWNVASGRQVGRDLVHDTAIIAVRLSPDLRSVATLTRDSTLRVWDLAAGVQVATIEHAHTLRDGMLYRGLIRYNPDSTEIFSADDSSVKVWDIRRAMTRGAELRDHVCNVALKGEQRFSDEDMKDSVLRGEGWRNPCDRYGMMSPVYWARLPGEIYRSIRGR